MIHYAYVDRSFGEQILRDIDGIVAKKREETKRIREQKTNKPLLLRAKALRAKARLQYDFVSEFLEP